ncbi:MAG: Thiamine-phosphate synthase [Candidatus Scalindua arabica]|uniref:Thiamine-phosphate synthase n=1 Tax=Candidatus Scalindua arabica TaxID=1127984 RepID=A0A942A772_9BACT|nr:Thiamine-phosphate synthase [Candidatus Scalindua arabica]
MAISSNKGLGFILITNRNICEAKLVDIISQAIDGGVETVQLREKDLSSVELYILAREIREITKKKGASLIINDRVDIALAVDADGVHLGWQSLDIEIVRKMIGHDKLIGFSAHNLQEAEKAENSGADYVTISPIFDTASKDYSIEPLGTEIIGKIKEEIDIPVIALGGINENNISSVLENGADGIAVISAILQSEDPMQSASRLYKEIKKNESKSEEKILTGREDAAIN